MKNPALYLSAEISTVISTVIDAKWIMEKCESRPKLLDEIWSTLAKKRELRYDPFGDILAI